MKQVDVREATHVKLKDGSVEKIASKWGIDANGHLAKSSEGGFGVVTEKGERVDMYHARLYLREDPDSAVWQAWAWKKKPVFLDDGVEYDLRLRKPIGPPRTSFEEAQRDAEEVRDREDDVFAYKPFQLWPLQS